MEVKDGKRVDARYTAGLLKRRLGKDGPSEPEGERTPVVTLMKLSSSRSDCSERMEIRGKALRDVSCSAGAIR